jgi:hypothetical protein
MTPEQFGKWGTAAGLAAGAFVAWPHVQPFAEWILFNLQVLIRVPFVQNGLLATAMGTAFCLALPWWLPGHFTTSRAQSSVRVLGAAFSFMVAMALDPSRTGFIFAVFCGFSGPMIGMALIRRLMACRWLPTPASLQPCTSERKAADTSDKA